MASFVGSYQDPTAACNLKYVYHGHTVREYLASEVPRTHHVETTIWSRKLISLTS